MPKLPESTLIPVSKFPVVAESERRKRIVMVVSPYPAPLEYIGPLDVFQIANTVLRLSGKSEMGYDLEIVSSQVGTIFETEGIKITTNKSYTQLNGKVDTLLFPPMDFEVLLSGQKFFLKWVKQQSKKVRRIVSFCSGAYILAAAGILNGRRASTHWDIVDDFRDRFPDVLLNSDAIYSKDEHIYTSAGLLAGIDLSLALVEEDFGRELALRVAQAMVIFLKRPGNQAQFSTQLSHELADNPKIVELQSYIYENLNEALSVEDLAARVNMSPRNFSRTFCKEVGQSPGKFVERCRLEIARQKLQQNTLSIAKVSEQVGYGSVNTMRIAFERHLGVNPRNYRQRFASSFIKGNSDQVPII